MQPEDLIQQFPRGLGQEWKTSCGHSIRRVHAKRAWAIVIVYYSVLGEYMIIRYSDLEGMVATSSPAEACNAEPGPAGL